MHSTWMSLFVYEDTVREVFFKKEAINEHPEETYIVNWRKYISNIRAVALKKESFEVSNES